MIRPLINAAATVNSTGPAASRLGLSIASRVDAADLSFYRGGALDSMVASAAGARPAGSMYLCGYNVSGVLQVPAIDNRIAAMFAGAGLNAVEAAAMHAALCAYLAAMGAA